ncbi:MAG: alpha/beta hydrolase [Anaerolineae bacterium]|nr:alpha/beta hydrolase [Anaerolineae bacterium]
MSVLKRWAWPLLLLPLLAVAGFAVWAYTPAAPMPQAQAALAPGPQVQVETEPWLVFQPAGEEPAAGLILYPGGRVDPRAYAPAARSIAASGHLVVIVPMPFNLAVFGVGRAAEVMAAFPGVERWAVGGHSLGGSMAARFARQNADLVDGLALWASYPAGSDDLSESGLQVLSIYGMRDGLATPDDIAASRPLLPPDTRWLAIEGGNHAQFGWYGVQGGDNPATISREDQQAQIVEATLRLLSDL